MSLTPAVTKDGFSFAGDLYAEASGHNRHRRATVSGLKDHFKSGSDKDHPAHWFEAQLVHYGLQPSKTKSVARMRLYDAVNAGKLSVPAHIQKLESDLKKEWIKKEREVKKAMKTSATSSTATGTKRKVDSSNVDLIVNVGGVNITVSANDASSSSSAVKKAKTSKTSTAKPAASAPTSQKTAASKKPTSTKPSSSASTSTTPAKKQTARRGGISQGPSRGSAATAETASPRPRTKQTARRSGAFMARDRIPAPGSTALDEGYRYDEPPPPYAENDNSSGLRPLGLLNGRYDIASNEVREQWGDENFDLVLTLSGHEMWGKFDLGIVSGILHFAERPLVSSLERVPFTWRGEETDGPIHYGNNNRGWIQFLGDGRIEGELDFMRLDFGGERLPGQGTRSEIDVATMRREWNGYSETEYERLNRARWG
ncbi:hypothetical protein F5Y19DRAFT_203728 [Xylariaceae sp. FL1651]|nr:hypothetical protein F5Y19DRAFT_203728 [Xylariaceae sp. FL1651]